MSDSFTFGIKSKLDINEVRGRLVGLWNGLGWGVAESSADDENLAISLYYYQGRRPEEREEIRNVVRTLAVCAADGLVAYYQDVERSPYFVSGGGYETYDRVLALDEIFGDEFSPNMGVPLAKRYLVKAE